MRFGNPAPTATEVAAGDLAGSGEENDPKATSSKRKRRPTPWAAGVAAARGHDMALRMDSFATGATTSRCAHRWSFHRRRQARLARGLRLAQRSQIAAPRSSRCRDAGRCYAARGLERYSQFPRPSGPMAQCGDPLPRRWTIFLVSGTLSLLECRRREISPGLPRGLASTPRDRAGAGQRPCACPLQS